MAHPAQSVPDYSSADTSCAGAFRLREHPQHALLDFPHCGHLRAGGPGHSPRSRVRFRFQPLQHPPEQAQPAFARTAECSQRYTVDCAVHLLGIAAARQIAGLPAHRPGSLRRRPHAHFQRLDSRFRGRHTDEPERHAACRRLDSGA